MDRQNRIENPTRETLGIKKKQKFKQHWLWPSEQGKIHASIESITTDIRLSGLCLDRRVQSDSRPKEDTLDRL
jgi:hypothetical protein